MKEQVPETSSSAAFWPVLPSLLWFAFAVFVVLLFRHELTALLRELSWRLKVGAAVKFGGLELGETYVDPGRLDAPTEHFQSWVDAQNDRFNQRRQYYEPNRGIILVHRVAPSRQAGQLYDVLLYLLPHKDANLLVVQRVEYYFGTHWGNRVFVCTDRARGFAIGTSAFGPFMATAKVVFTDGESVYLSRYIDFEMGALPRKAT